ncbi:glycosyltransferase family 4 protein [Thomasclavelia spiroformis]|uniref:glycosyltransferase family 4 protein n=1 Tax=Thomasclavelia spiroformis TaxID=29348 RepID=UPI0024B09DE1|nr:glycosyltransferase family 4 protein [Thomasclavelia spiroformis]
MKKVLILMGRYLPGYKDGGPVRTIKNLTDIFGKEYDIRIMCKDRDHGDLQQYPNIAVDTYNKVGNANVYYVKNEKFKFKNMLNEIKKVDIVYCCGPYNDYAIKAMVLKRLGFFKMPLVIASMGSFSKGALSIKSKKKMIFLYMMKKLGFFKKIVWSVTSNIEEKELKKNLGENEKCIIAEDLPRIKKIDHFHKKKKNRLKIIFISRICEKKNLLGAIKIISNLTEFPIQFDIYGNIEDKEYWKSCKKELEKLPINIKWKYQGECDSNNVIETLANYDIFLFPTFGENFGHVISEALLAGCVAVISDQTPWLDLDNYKCGNVINLKNINSFVDVLVDYTKMDEIDFNIYVRNAQKYIEEKNYNSIKNTGYKEIFNL